MLKLIGAVMIFGSCAALGLSARQSLRKRVAAADAMLMALSLISSEISCRRAPLPEIIGTLAENENPTVRLVFGGLQRRLREQNGLSLSYLWRVNLRDNRAEAGLGAPECDPPRARRRPRNCKARGICTAPAASRSGYWSFWC